jgi:hypothetical protein
LVLPFFRIVVVAAEAVMLGLATVEMVCLVLEEAVEPPPLTVVLVVPVVPAEMEGLSLYAIEPLFCDTRQ